VGCLGWGCCECFSIFWGRMGVNGHGGPWRQRSVICFLFKKENNGNTNTVFIDVESPP
jgi:hypothetical protein